MLYQITIQTKVCELVEILCLLSNIKDNFQCMIAEILNFCTHQDFLLMVSNGLFTHGFDSLCGQSIFPLAKNFISRAANDMWLFPNSKSLNS